MRLLDTSHMWYNSQGYDEILVKFVTLKSHMLDYFIPSDYVRRSSRALFAFKMGQRSTTEYIDDFRKHLVNYRDM